MFVKKNGMHINGNINVNMFLVYIMYISIYICQYNTYIHYIHYIYHVLYINCVSTLWVLGPTPTATHLSHVSNRVASVLDGLQSPSHPEPEDMFFKKNVRWHRKKSTYASNPQHKRICLYNILTSMHVCVCRHTFNICVYK